MKRMFRMLCCLLAVVMLMSAMPLTVSAVEPYYGNSCTLCMDCDRLVTFNNPVHRIYGNTRYETSLAIADTLKRHLGREAFDFIVIASGTGFADALAGSFLAANLEAPILLTNGNNIKSIESYIRQNLAPDGTIFILGGPSAVPSSVEAALADYSLYRLWGNSRYETNLEILNVFDLTGVPILVCSGKGFADSLSVSSLGLPILLVKDRLTDEQKAFLQEYDSNAKIIIGGTSAVSSTVERELTEVSSGMVDRVGGQDRFETSVMVAEYFYLDPTVLTVAYARNFPDGLCGGPLAFAIGAPMILTADGKEAAAAAYAQKNHACWGYVLGGSKLIADSVAKRIFVPRNDNEGGDFENYDYVICETPEPLEIFSVGELALAEESMDMMVNRLFLMNMTAPADTEYVVWSTSNPEVVQVSARGEVRTISEGTAVIQVTDGITRDFCEIRVVSEHTPEEKDEIARQYAQSIADRVMNDPACKTDLDRVAMAARIVNQYVAWGVYSTHHVDYNKPYGTFVAGFSSCAGSTKAMGLVLECMGFEWEHVNENEWTHQWCIVYDMDGQTGFADGSTYGIAGYGSRETDTWYLFVSDVGAQPLN